ncbi:hypothetical protein BN946_scf184657.g5 [Trametes cinnabarina]|uniref:Uncharacterized protein n=1 Tax=Pycnoporus cinnabarinus TaxID=5643 RepID=A0A060SRW6_PYCCI|nr:hypothetical protein BN946_scf184657.g5 [Trametes cinnabarina]
MGGNAFKAIAADAIFPRMPPAVYEALKSSLLPILQSLYSHVIVPREAPGKKDYGDVDFVVCCPREGLTADKVKAALRASYSVPMEGHRTSNYAIAPDAWEDVARVSEHWVAEIRESSRSDEHSEGSGTSVYLQVDVNVSADNAQLERKAFYSSYGDLGLLLGLLAQSAGLSFSIYGLKLAEPVGSPPQTFYLSDNFTEILSFLGLSMERWERDFTNQDELFRWIASSPFAVAFAERLKASDGMPFERDRVEARPMRQNFIAFLREHRFPDRADEGHSVFAQPGNKEEKLAATLKYFGKEKEYVAIVDAARAATRAKAILNGTNVQEWTGVRGMPVRFILDEVKERLTSWRMHGNDGKDLDETGDIPAWQRALLDMTDAEVRGLTVRVKEELDAAGKLMFDWRAAKAAKLEQKRQKELASSGVGEQETASVSGARGVQTPDSSG